MLKITQDSKNLIIKNSGDVSVVDISNLENAHKAIQTLASALMKTNQANADLQKSIGDELPEGFDSEASFPLFRDLTLNIPSQVSKGIKSAMAYSPTHLQAQVLKNAVQSIAQVYKDAGEMIMNSTDTTLLSKSLFQKSMLIKRDLELLEEQLDAPLNQIKQIKMEKAMRSAILKKGIEQGKLIAKTEGYVGIDSETLEMASALNKTKKVLKDKHARNAQALESAKSVLSK